MVDPSVLIATRAVSTINDPVPVVSVTLPAEFKVSNPVPIATA